jgi:hypothetical protein
MKRLAGFTVLAVLTVAIAVPAQEQPTAHPYYPLKTGAEWKYKVQGGPITVKVTGTEKVGMVNGFKLETSANNKVSATETVAITAEGVKRFNVNGLNPEAPILFLPADPMSTKEWSVDTKVAGQTIKGTFKANVEKVTVPLATYDNAVHVKGADMEIGATKTTVEYRFVKDIGIVKLKFTLGSQDATLELESYSAGK